MKGHKAAALAAMTIVLLAPFAGVCALDEDDETDAVAPIIALALGASEGIPAAVSVVKWGLTLMGLSAAAGFSAGAFVTYELMDSQDPSVHPYLRLMAARALSESMDTAVKFSSNANANYAQVWAATKEHWVRQAELEAYAEWGPDADYDADRILERSQLYRNAAVMSANAVAQVNLFLDAQAERTEGWESKDAYSGLMGISFRAGGREMSSSDGDWRAELLSVADVGNGPGRVYIGLVQGDDVLSADGYEPSRLIALDDRTTISGEGMSFVLKKGENMLSELRTLSGQAFKPGIYRLSGTVAGDTLAEVTGPSALELRPGMAIRTGGSLFLAHLDGSGSVILNGASYGSLSFKVTPGSTPSGPDTEKPEPVDLKGMMESYGALLRTMGWTAASAERSARAVWDVYCECASKEYSVTTLMAPDAYDGYVLGAGMKEAMTLSSMQQLAAYYQEHSGDLGGLYIGLYGSGDVSSSFFVRGSVTDGLGRTLYEDVVYTPFFQSENETLKDGSDHRIGQNALVMVWGRADGLTLPQWYEKASSEGVVHYETAFAERGWTLGISELAECDGGGMHPKDAVSLKVTQVSFVDPEKTRTYGDPDPQQKGTNWLLFACLALGIVLAAYGIVRREPVYIVAGAAVMIAGLLLGDAAWGWISGWKGSWGLLRWRRGGDGRWTWQRPRECCQLWRASSSGSPRSPRRLRGTGCRWPSPAR